MFSGDTSHKAAECVGTELIIVGSANKKPLPMLPKEPW
jgi:hypothetical protein